jgi:transcriptional regulator with XRE-family HTH domain
MEMWTKVEQLVKAKGLNWARLAKIIGEHESRISKWRHGDGEVNRHQLLRIARTLDVSADYLADDAQEEPPAPAAIADWERTVIELIKALRLDAGEAMRRLAAGGASPIRDDRPAIDPRTLPPPGPRVLPGAIADKPGTLRKKRQG